MRGKALAPELEQLLLRSHFAYVCTVDGDNCPHVTPIFYLFDPSPPSIYFLTSLRSKKIVNMESNPMVALTIDRRDTVAPQNNFGVFIRGKPELLGELSSTDQMVEWERTLFDSFKDKYPIFNDWLSMHTADIKAGPLVWVKLKFSSLTWWMNWVFKTLRFR